MGSHQSSPAVNRLVKNFVPLLLSLILLVTFPCVSTAISCLTSLDEFPSETSYESIRDEEYPAFEPRLNGGSFLPRVVRTRTFFVRSQPLAVQVITVETRPEISSDASLEKDADRLGAEGKAKFLTDISEWVDFAITEYSRRPWTPRFTKKLRQFAIDYAHRSTYIVARRRTGDVLGEIQGTLRLISSSHYGQKVIGPAGESIRIVDRGVPLPMEVFLSRILPRPWFPANAPAGLPDGFLVGEVLEPGNYAILKRADQLIKEQILIHLLGVLVKPSFRGILSPQAKQIYTYGDSTSIRKYHREGFTLLDGVPAIKKDGTNWQVLKATTEDLKKILTGLQTNKRSAASWELLQQDLEYLLSVETRH